MKYSAEQIEKMDASLQSLPNLDKSRPIHNKMEVTTMLKGEIIKLKDIGYSLEEIAIILRKNKLDSTLSTLKNHMQPAKASTREDAQNNRKKPAKAKQNQALASDPHNSPPTIPEQMKENKV